ncbi:MAG: 4-hydroxy-tetrahydrodipicolinate synthase [Desulfovibrionaceae bacterium]|nr:4-hydroxy-tetrahydrodipicolinate synthase [Desulfovibrionaceae bacterium]
MRFCGAYTALVTPFRNGGLDEEAYRALVEWQIEQGIDGLVPCGTTGESATMSHAEHEEAIRICVDQAAGRVPVLAGAGSNYTKEAISLTKFAKKVGADGALHITPYYNKPTQEGLYQHFKAIAEAVDIPLVLYNVPGRTGVNMLPATIARIARDVPGVVGVKEATANLQQISDVIEQCSPDFCVLSGDDFTIPPTFAIGGCGVISVLSNIMPKETAQLCKAAREGNLKEAQRLHYMMMPLCRALFIETNPIPVKTALALMGKMDLELRLPLVEMAPANLDVLKTALKNLNLI